MLAQTTVYVHRLDPDDPQRLSISSKLKFGPRTEEETARLKRWEEVWERFPPGVYEKKQKSWAESALKYSLPEKEAKK